MENIENKLFQFKVDADGIGILTINQVDNPANLFSMDFIRAFIVVAEEAVKDDSVKGVIITSGRSMFMPGADLRELENMDKDADQQLQELYEFHKAFRAIETSGKPFVAAINGTAMGGGLELCLLCHHRIVLNNPRIKLGFPESKVGLLPGGGGTVKAPYLMGIQNGLVYLLQGKEVRPAQALKDGLVDALADSPEELIVKAKKWILENQQPVQPWDNPQHKIPGGGIDSPVGIQTMAAVTDSVARMTHGNYPAQTYILKVVSDGLKVPIDKALEIEAQFFTKLVGSKEAKNMIRTGFLGMQAAKKGKARPKQEPKYEIRKLGILGAGMMGAGIAYVSAKSGMEVVLKDISVEAAERGKGYSKKVLDKAIAKKRSTPEKAKTLLDRIHPTTDIQSIAGADLIIEAVFEDPILKDKVTKEAEAVLGRDKIYASNTSTIPITLLAKSSERPENFIGIHFFSPVDRMPLVEIIVGEKTGDRAIAAAVDYTVAIGKVPIVVNDSRGFFTSRCFATYLYEGMFLLEEGVPAAMIEKIAKEKGMPVGPLAVHDEVTLTLSLHVHESDPNPNKKPYTERGYAIVKDLVHNHGRTSKKDGKGFYDYPVGEKKRLWSELDKKFNSKKDALDIKTIAQRLMHRQALESFRCLDEGVLNSVVDGDIGSVLGWGFPIYTGGAVSYIDFIGIKQFVADCDNYKEKYGERWEVPATLRSLATAGKSVHEFKKVVTS